MDIKDLKTLIKMVTETDITEFEMENTEEKISIRRGTTQEIVHVAAPAQMAAPAVAAAPVMQAPAAPAPAAAPAAGTALGERQEIINSPIVGTFYRAPSPESASYVEVGSVVEKGQVFCIVEAMKLMNEIEADFKCKVIEILKENAQPVEFGDPLFVVEKL
ncbi:acetyl-CoA carboxylase biotin carboxyl carrier protein [Desulfuromonas sp. AOP6]|uniref:acetyl-CoA carboxylase biotin carboxyl carrier protein n=1 Tax=Desulfuromonas sp. AOP6 TaxID=1566351 RepID=UPI00128379D4|nr:acetyl-CoA carboxylase biotin carboxyl carrier protein [Desulfuromonas sp. AOP6]BCA80190.1 acetyl-CoA carboxylase, biotin carboxyl carrier protein [Desulfuromonas sp. AOP6]